VMVLAGSAVSGELGRGQSAWGTCASVSKVLVVRAGGGHQQGKQREQLFDGLRN